MSRPNDQHHQRGEQELRRAQNQRRFSLMDHLPFEHGEVTSRYEEARKSVTDLHSFVDLVDQVRSLRLRGLGLLIVLNVSDIVTTAGFLARGGKEGNPLLAPIIERWWPIVLIKAIILAAVSLNVLSAPTRSVSAQRFVAVACVFYSVVVAWNVAVFLRL